MNRLYEKLKEDTNFKHKMIFGETENCLTIVLHEYLSIKYLEGNYTASYDEGYMCYTRTEGDTLYNRPVLFGGHFHIQDDEEAFEAVIDFTTRDNIYIEDVRRFSFSPIKVMTKEKFEKKRAKFMAKKHLRIFSSQEIIKRSEQ